MAAAPKLATALAVMLVAVVVGYVLVLADEQAVLEASRTGAAPALVDYSGKLPQAVNLPELRKQKSQVEEYVTQLEKQLPGKAGSIL